MLQAEGDATARHVQAFDAVPALDLRVTDQKRMMRLIRVLSTSHISKREN